MMPCSCAASSASAICFAIGSASSSGIGPCAMRCDSVVALDQFHHEGVHATGFFEAVDRRDVGMIQRGERSSLRVGTARAARDRCANASGRTLIATSRSSFVSRARYTSPMPPAPMGGEDFIGAEAGAGSEGHQLSSARAASAPRPSSGRRRGWWARRSGPAAALLDHQKPLAVGGDVVRAAGIRTRNREIALLDSSVGVVAAHDGPRSTPTRMSAPVGER